MSYEPLRDRQRTDQQKRITNENVTDKNIRLRDFIVHVVLALFLIISWGGFPTIVIVPVGLYAAYRFVTWASGGFRCMHCMSRFASAAGLFLIVTLQLSAQFYIVAIALILISAATTGLRTGKAHGI
jgi:hypothetical protein